MKRTFITTVLIVVALPLRAQVPADSVRTLVEVAKEAQRIGAAHGEQIFPGFRPDTIPMSFVIPSRGDVLVGWRGPLPSGYVAIPATSAGWRDMKTLSAASTAVELQGRRVAQVSVSTLEPAMLAATAVHEAFHVFEAASRKPGKKFGAGENSMLVASYPVFDPRNEMAFALEGMLLSRALTAQTKQQQRDLARQFVAVRRERHRNMPASFAEFDQLSELNEGLAEYALVRALRYVELEGPLGWRASAQKAFAPRVPLLENLTGTENLSLRFRFYQTGPAEGLLLDALMGSQWKQRMLDTDATLQDMLGIASGVDDVVMAARASAERVAKSSGLSSRIEQQIAALRESRRLKMDSLLSRPGIQLVLMADSLPGKNFNSCGYDPQNLLQVSATVQIQTRWWKPCAGGPTNAEFNVPSVHDEEHGSIRAVIGEMSELKLTSNGQPLTLHDGELLRDVRTFKLLAPRASVDAVRADVELRGSQLRIYPKRLN